MGPWIQKKTPHTPLLGDFGVRILFLFKQMLAGQPIKTTSISFEMFFGGWKCPEIHFRRWDFCWGWWLHLKVDAKIKLVATKIKKSFGWIFVLIVSKPVFVGGNLPEILGDGIPPPDFLLQNCAPSIASIVTAELFEVKTMELIKPQGWGGGYPRGQGHKKWPEMMIFVHWQVGFRGDIPPQ